MDCKTIYKDVKLGVGAQTLRCRLIMLIGSALFINYSLLFLNKKC